MQTIMLVAHMGVCLLIVALVLLQRGKGAEAGTGFGAGASGTVFGSRGSANFLSRTTAALATAFFVTSLTLAFFATQQTQTRDQSVIERLAPGAGAGSETRVGPASDDIDAPPPLPAGSTQIDESSGDSGLPAFEPNAGQDAPASGNSN